MKRSMRVALAASAAAVVLTAIPVGANPLTGYSPAFAEENGPVDPPLFDETQDGGTVRVNVLLDGRSELSSASEAGEVLVSYETLPMVTLRVDRAGLDSLSTMAGVVSVSEDIPVEPTLNESTAKIGSDAAVAAGKTGAGSAIAILDTGVATGHPFLAGRVKAEACFSVTDAAYGATSLCPNGAAEQEGPGSADADSGPCTTVGTGCSHGTHVAGIAAGNGAGVTGAPTRGVAPGADIIAMQVFSKFTSDSYCGPGASPCVLSFTSSQIKALEKVAAMKSAGTNVIAANMSLGGGRWTAACAADPRKPIIDTLFSQGVATVVAAGNNGYANAVNAPGCVPSALTVGSTTDDDQLSTFSNRGPLLDVLAPGTGIVSSVPGGGFASKNGTSMAAPHVAGALAILRQAHPGKTLAELEALLKDSGTPITYTGAVTPRLRIDLPKPPPRPRFTDLNCDTIEDTVVGDPKAAVGGQADAGVVRVIYGGGKGTAELHQDLAAIPGDAEAGDSFGENLATFDHDEDGCSDLVVGIPGEDIGAAADAGAVNVLYGAASGLSTGKAALNLIQGTGEGAIKSSTPEAGDRFGHAVAAGHTAQGQPYLLIGVPGEDLGTVQDTGIVYYLRGTTNVATDQNKPGVDGDNETGDRFGSTIAASANHIVIGSPNEGIGAQTDAGSLQVFTHQLTADGLPTPVLGLNQNDTIVGGLAETGDRFAGSLAAVAYVPSGASAATDTVVAVGSPGEGLTVGSAPVDQAGHVHTFRITGAGAVTRTASINAEAANVAGVAAAGDHFGQSLTLANLSPDAPATASTLVLAVGIPGKDIGGAADAGAVQTFNPLGTPGDTDQWIQAGDTSGLGGTPTAGHAIGAHLGATTSALHIGVPHTPSFGAAYALPWGNATAGRTGNPGTVTTHQPGQNGLPAVGGAFGWSIG
ncbi:S8 family serine peptidase [Streptomyces sp. NPDC048349]|uniref:S8 family serine peptidase n=1 Tax=Streptomyces sp. NPDC048349 TaxID=3155486 RepID=UPI0034323522